MVPVCSCGIRHGTNEDCAPDHECPEFGMCPVCWSIPIGELHDKVLRAMLDEPLTECLPDPLRKVA